MSAAGWGAFCLEALEDAPAAMRRKDAAAAFGEGLAVFLERSGVLVPGGYVPSMPSPMPEDSPGPWFVEPLGDGSGFWAYPADYDETGLFATLSATEAEGVRVDVRALARLVRNALSLEGAPDMGQPVQAGVFHVGESLASGIVREALLAPSARLADVAGLLRLREAACVPTLLLAPSRRCVPPSATRFAGHGPVSLAFLDEALDFDGSEVAAASPAASVAPRRPVPAAFGPLAGPAPAVAPERPAGGGSRAMPYACLTQDGPRDLSREEYDELEKALDEFDLVLDLTRTTRAGRYLVQKRESGAVVRGSVSAAQGEAYAELMELGARIRPSRLKRLGGTLHPRHELDLARAALDVRVGRYEWRATRLFKGDVPEAVEYRFDPPRGMKWALVREKRG